MGVWSFHVPGSNPTRCNQLLWVSKLNFYLFIYLCGNYKYILLLLYVGVGLAVGGLGRGSVLLPRLRFESHQVQTTSLSQWTWTKPMN